MAEERPRRFTAAAAAAALAQLNELDDENSGNDSSEEEGPVIAQHIESDDSTDSEISEPESDVSVSTTRSRNQANVLQGRDGTSWSVYRGRQRRGPSSRYNVLRSAPGPSNYAQRIITSPKDAFMLIIDTVIVTWIVKFTNLEAER